MSYQHKIGDGFWEWLREADSAQNTIELSGLGEDEVGNNLPYDNLIDTLEYYLKIAENHKNHEHQWNDEDLCNVCGLDGRA